MEDVLSTLNKQILEIQGSVELYFGPSGAVIVEQYSKVNKSKVTLLQEQLKSLLGQINSLEITEEVGLTLVRAYRLKKKVSLIANTFNEEEKKQLQKRLTGVNAFSKKLEREEATLNEQHGRLQAENTDLKQRFSALSPKRVTDSSSEDSSEDPDGIDDPSRLKTPTKRRTKDPSQLTGVALSQPVPPVQGQLPTSDITTQSRNAEDERGSKTERVRIKPIPASLEKTDSQPVQQQAVFDENTIEDVIEGLKAVYDNRKSMYKDNDKIFTPKDYQESDQFKVKRGAGEQLKIKDFAPKVFHQIRLYFGVSEEAYIKSFTRSNLTAVKGQGKSGAFFIFTNDKQFILKTANGEERDFLVYVLEFYWQHIQNYPNTLLPRFYGVYSMKHEGSIGGVTRFVIMNNLFNTPFELVTKYDLKGSFMGRSVSEKKRKPGTILKDLDIEHDNRKLYIPKNLRKEFIEQLKIDTTFLSNNKVMDYSLLLGIAYEPAENPDKFNEMELKKWKENPYVIQDLFQNKFQKHFNGLRVTRPDNTVEVYYIGIIDILIQYVAKKKVEHIFKTLAFPGEEVSVVNPKYYSDRFFDFIKNLVYVPEDEPADEPSVI